MQTTINQVSVASRPRSHAYYGGMAALLSLAILAGFSRSYYTVLVEGPPLAPVVHLHAAVFAGWFAILLAQTTLVASGRTSLHRRLGWSVTVLAPLMIVLGWQTAIQGARDNWNPGGAFSDPLAFMAVPIADLMLFAGFCSAGFWYRRQSEVHKRLMILASVGLMWPAITRLVITLASGAGPSMSVIGMYALFMFFAFSGPLYDLITKRRTFGFEIYGAVLIVASRPLTRMIAETDAWHNLAAWLIR